MKLMTERGQVLDVADEWRKVYCQGHRYGSDKDSIQIKLDALDVETATAADVAAIIGNDEWVKPRTCNECGADTYDAVQLGEEPDYESSTAIVCLDCLRKAVALFEGAK